MSDPVNEDVVYTTDGGEVRRMARLGCLRVFVTIEPRVERPPGKKPVVIDRYQVCDVPLGTEPAAAVATCRRGGLVVEEPSGVRGLIPMLLPEVGPAQSLFDGDA